MLKEWFVDKRKGMEKIDVRHLPDGLYLVMMGSQNTVLTKRLIIQK
jgi:hypothetical protein